MSKYILYFLLLFSVTVSWGQEEDRQRKLEEQKARLQEEIRQQERLLQTEKKKEKSVVKVVAQQNQKIGFFVRTLNEAA